MGQRGPAPEPAALRILKGETRPSQLKGAPGPQEPPKRPADLSPDAAKVWDRILRATADTSHIGQAHAEALRQYAELTVQINAMQPKGSKEWRDLVFIHLRLARELCLTPATSTNLIKQANAEDKLSKYLA